MTRNRILSVFVPMVAFTCLTFELFVQAQQKEKLTENSQPSAKNSNGKLAAGDHTRTVRVGDLERRYRIYIPKKYDASKPATFVMRTMPVLVTPMLK